MNQSSNQISKSPNYLNCCLLEPGGDCKFLVYLYIRISICVYIYTLWRETQSPKDFYKFHSRHQNAPTPALSLLGFESSVLLSKLRSPVLLHSMAKPKEEKSDDLEITSIGALHKGPWDKKYWSSSRVRFHLFPFNSFSFPSCHF